MKERTFYTINLDSRRIIFLSAIFLLILVYSFFLGYSLGKKKGLKDATSSSQASNKPPKKEEPIARMKKPVIQSEEEVSMKASEDNLLKSEIIPIGPTKKETNEEAPPEKETPPVEKKVSKKKKWAQKKLEIEKTGPFYTLQLGAFRSKEQASKFRQKLIAGNKPVAGKLNPYIHKNGELYVVRMGKASTRKELEKISSRLDEEARNTAIIVKQSN